MTRFRQMMRELFKANSASIDQFKSVERQIWFADKAMKEWKTLEGRGNIGRRTANFYGSNHKDSQTSMKNFKVIMDEFFYSNDEFEIDVSQTDSWIFHKIKSKETLGVYDLDLGMSSIKGCKKIVTKVRVENPQYFREEIKYECEEVSDAQPE